VKKYQKITRPLSLEVRYELNSSSLVKNPVAETKWRNKFYDLETCQVQGFKKRNGEITAKQLNTNIT